MTRKLQLICDFVVLCGLRRHISSSVVLCGLRRHISSRLWSKLKRAAPP